MKRIIWTNVVIALAILIAVETLAWAIIKFHRTRQGPGGIRVAAEYVAPSQPSDSGETSAYSSERVASDLATHRFVAGSPYKYESYVVYQNKPYQSHAVNIAEDGHRLNGATGNPANNRVIWMFGSSALYGATNADDETVPAYLEKALSIKWPARVVNYGVVAFTSWQDVAHFKVRLAQNAKPDLVIFFNGITDHYRAWTNESEDCRYLFDTGVSSSDVLRQGWVDHAYGNIIRWSALQDLGRALFPNSLELARLSLKFLELRIANRNVDAWKRAYRERREKQARIVMRCYDVAERAYVTNMVAAVAVAKEAGVPIALIHQPLIYASNKPLAGSSEINEVAHAELEFFAKSDTYLASMQSVQSFQLNQQFVWSKEEFIRSYERLGRRLKEVADAHNVIWIDVKPQIDQAGPVAVFSTAHHFTFRGAKIVANAIADQIPALAR